MTIAQYFEQDHDRLDGLFRAYQENKRTNFGKAFEAFVSFKFGLQRHILWEEEILFPLFEEKTGLTDGGPTAVMRKEHRLIHEELEAIHRKVQRKDPETDLEDQRLFSELSIHNEKEEMILYPAIDRSLNGPERETVFQRMEALPRERYETCC